MTPLRIGVTGPIGCGKSTLAAWLGERPGVVVIDADALARDVLAPGTPETAAVLARFGEDLRGTDGSLDRAALGRIVFADPAALAALEAIVHPAVRVRILGALDRAAADGAVAVVIEAIKLVEGGLGALCDEIWLIICDPHDQRVRLEARGAEPDDAEARIRAQGDLVARIGPKARRVIDTSGSREGARARVAATLAAALEAQSESLST